MLNNNVLFPVARHAQWAPGLVRGDPLSPAAFGMSVHHAIAGMLTIARNDQAHRRAR